MKYNAFIGKSNNLSTLIQERRNTRFGKELAIYDKLKTMVATVKRFELQLSNINVLSGQNLTQFWLVLAYL